MKLTTADKVLERMNLSGTIGSSNTTSIDSSLEAATTMIESIIRTSLKASSRKDYFDYSISRYASFKPFNLWLSQAFVSGKIKIYFSDNTTAVDLTTARLLESTEYTFDQKTGKVTILSEPYRGFSTIMVKYSAGFKEGASSIPGWLEEAAISASIFMNHTQSIAHGKKDAQAMTKPLSGIIYSQVNEYILTPYNGLYPSNTIVS